MTAVDIVYTSCHDAVRVPAGWCAASPQPGSCAGAGALGLAGVAPLGGRARAGLPPSPHILAWAHSGAWTWTPALHLLLRLPGSSLAGKELRDTERHSGGERAAPRPGRQDLVLRAPESAEVGGQGRLGAGLGGTYCDPCRPQGPVEPDSWALKETCFRHFPTSGPSPGATEAHELPFSQVYETPFYVAVDHDKKKVVISIRGTLSPKVRRPVTPPAPWAPSQPLGGAPTFSLFSAPRLTVLPAPQDALTDLTGDAERLPVEGHHGTWLGHKVPPSSRGPPVAPRLLLSAASRQAWPAVGAGAPPESLLSPREMVRAVWISLEGPLPPTGREPHSPVQPRPCPTRESSRRQWSRDLTGSS